MFNLFKMYCYKMFRQKSLYIIWLVLFGFEILSLPMVTEEFAELSVEMGAFYILLVSIFSTIFFSEDISSSFIKNYAGTISNRSTIIMSRTAMLLVQNLLTLAFMFISLWGIAIYSGLAWNEGGFIAKYYVCMFLVGLTCSYLSMMFTELIRKPVPVMILSIAVGMGLISQSARILSGMLSNGRFIISSYMVTGTFSQLNIESTGGDLNAAMLIAIVYMVLAVGVGAAHAATKKSIYKRTDLRICMGK